MAMSEQKISDQAVQKATGKSWKQWVAALDRWNASSRSHKEIARHLASEHGVSAWWSQAVTVRYEQVKGLRAVGEKRGGFDVSVQRTIGVPVAKAWDAFTDAGQLSTWFTTRAKVDLRMGGRYSIADGDEGEFRRIDPRKLLRFTWENAIHCPGTMVEVTFDPKGKGKSVVRLTHSKLADAKAREGMKEGWAWAMDNLKGFLEQGQVQTFEAWREERAPES
jgi:uncharacterized protein YndB with AHSA1/START domain